MALRGTHWGVWAFLGCTVILAAVVLTSGDHGNPIVPQTGGGIQISRPSFQPESVVHNVSVEDLAALDPRLPEAARRAAETGFAALGIQPEQEATYKRFIMEQHEFGFVRFEGTTVQLVLVAS